MILRQTVIIRSKTLIYWSFSATLLEELLRTIIIGMGYQVPGVVSLIDTTIYLLAYLGIGLVEIRKNEHRSLFLSIVISLMMSLLFFAFSKINPEISIFRNQFIAFILRLPLFIYLGCELFKVEDFFALFPVMTHIAVIYAFLNILWVSQEDYYMLLSYYILPWAGISYLLWSERKKSIYLFEAIFLCLVLLAFGARMPFLCVLFLISIDYFLIRKGRNAKVVILFLFVLICFVLISVFRNEINALISKAFPNSKTINKFLSGDLFEASQRTRIYKSLIHEISEKPLEIRGFYSERIFLGNKYVDTNELGIWITEENQYSVYAHNILIEMIFDFGLILGCVMLMWLLVHIIRGFRCAKRIRDSYYLRIMLYFFSIGFLPLMVSNSYLSYMSFWMFVGMLLQKQSSIYRIAGIDFQL